MAADNPTAHQASLAGSLNSLGFWLDHVGRYPEALEATQEAVTLYRALAADNPAAYQAGLEMSLDNLGIRLHKMGRYPEALEATQEAVTLHRALILDLTAEDAAKAERFTESRRA